MFSEEFRQRLELGRYTAWASNLSEDHLEALFSMLGGFRLRCAAMFARLQIDFEAMDSESESARGRDAFCALVFEIFDVKRLSNESAAMFSQEFRQRLNGWKHAYWACNLAEGELETILRHIGEFAEHGELILTLIESHFSKEATSRYQFGRSKFALESVVHFVAGERYNEQEFSRRVCANIAAKFNSKSRT